MARVVVVLDDFFGLPVTLVAAGVLDGRLQGRLSRRLTYSYLMMVVDV